MSDIIRSRTPLCSHILATTQYRIDISTEPTRVKNVSVKFGNDPSSSIRIYWDEVNAEKKGEVTKYCVSVESVDCAIKREALITTNTLLVQSLQSGTEYNVTVCAGNSDGFGQKSEVHSIVTSKFMEPS